MKFDSMTHDEITFYQAVERLKDGKTVFADNGYEYKITGDTVLSRDGVFKQVFEETKLMFSVAVLSKWYIKKPFDVRQAMRDKPDEWVGAYERHGRWYKAGFDSRCFRAVETRVYIDIEVDFTNAECSYIDPDALDNCIPLDEVPADAR